MASYGGLSDLLELQLTSLHVILTKVSSEVRTADAERVKNFGRSVTTSVQVAKPLRGDITEEQWGTLKNPKQY